MYSEYLQFSGFQVVEAGNGMEALQRALADQPDIILMDLSLPVMDGLGSHASFEGRRAHGQHSDRRADGPCAGRHL